MMKEFSVTTRLVTGPGSRKALPDHLKKMDVRNILIVTDKGIVGAGVLDKLLIHLDEFNCKIYDEVIPNPDVSSVTAAFDQVKEYEIDLVIAIGGGSSMDTAKSICVLYNNSGSIRDYIGREMYKKDPLPLVSIPTTVGTGSEVTRACAIKDPNTNMKEIIGGASMASKIALLDAELLSTLPSPVVAATGMDTLTHAIEGYMSKNSSEVTDALNLHSIKLVGKYLREAVADSSNTEAVQKMLEASTITGIGFGNALLGLVHSISHAIGGHYEAPHGVLNAILLPKVFAYNWIGNQSKLLGIAQALSIKTEDRLVEDVADDVLNYMIRLSKDIHIPEKLNALGIDDSLIDTLTEQIYDDIYIPINPRKPSKQEIKNILLESL